MQWARHTTAAQYSICPILGTVYIIHWIKYAVPGISGISTGISTGLNDDVTTMDIVVKILIMVFKKDKMTAVRLMLEVHHNGAAVVDVLPLEQAELRQLQTHSMAQKEGYPLRCMIEPA